ncbi:MAG TPA: hypothetical protein VIM41_14960 [Gammaproteobacteria bacterium]
MYPQPISAPDTGKKSACHNSSEFIAALPEFNRQPAMFRRFNYPQQIQEIRRIQGTPPLFESAREGTLDQSKHHQHDHQQPVKKRINT